MSKVNYNFKNEREARQQALADGTRWLQKRRTPSEVDGKIQELTNLKNDNQGLAIVYLDALIAHLEKYGKREIVVVAQPQQSNRQESSPPPHQGWDYNQARQQASGWIKGRRLVQMYASAQANPQLNAFHRPLLAAFGTAIVLGFVGLPPAVFVLAAGLVARWVAEQQGMDLRKAQICGILPALPAFLGQWFILAVAIAIHFFFWGRESAPQMSSGNGSEGHAEEGMPEEL